MPENFKDNLIGDVLVKYALNQLLTQDEEEAFASWQAESNVNRLLAERFGDPEWVAEHRRELHQAPKDEIWERIQQNLARKAREAGIPTELAVAQDLPVSTVPGAPVKRLPLVTRERALWGIRVLAGAALFFGFIWGGDRIRETFRPEAAPAVLREVPVSMRVPTRTEVRASKMVARAAAMERFQYRLQLGGGEVIRPDTLPINKDILLGDGQLLRRTDSNVLLIQIVPGSPAASGEGLLNQLTVAHGNLLLKFPDRSRVWLDSGSSLRYSAERGGQMMLAGQAFFDITHDQQRPLEILAGKLSVRLLGTRLNVRNYPHERDAKVTLYSDSAQVRTNSSSLVVHSRHEAVFPAEGAPELRTLPRTSGSPDWIARSGGRVFRFHKASLQTVAQALADRYGLILMNPHHVEGVPITGSSSADGPIEIPLHAINRVSAPRAWLKVRGDTLTILRTRP